VGGFNGTQYYSAKFPEFVVDQSMHISQLEMLNILVALRTWAPSMTRSTIKIICDNAAAIAVLTSGRGVDPILLACAREVWLVSATYDCTIVPTHRPGITMTTVDALSRAHLTGDRLPPTVKLRLQGSKNINIHDTLFQLKNRI
jgi:hypothetical protein